VRSLAQLRVPPVSQRESRHDLDVAIEQASNAPTMQTIARAAQASLLGIVIVFWAGGWLCALIVVALVSFAVPVYVRVGTRSSQLADKYQQRRATLHGRQLSVLRHVFELRALGALEHGAAEIEAATNVEQNAALSALRLALQSSLVTEFLSGVSIGLVAMVVGFGLLGARISLGHALIAVLVTSEMFSIIRRFGAEFHRRDDAERALALLATTPHFVPAHDSSVLVRTAQLISLGLATPLSLNIEAGDRVLVTGASGTGKTTLLETMVGWRQASFGVVSTSGRVGVVRPSGHLLAGTLRDNLCLGSDIDDDVVVALLGDLGLHDERFGDLDYVIGDDARTLSSGERVKLLLVRALLASCDLLVIDDVAGVLDTESRQQFQSILEQRPRLAILEAAIDRPLLSAPNYVISLDVQHA
jgi:ABC-type transport system involved in cytochrome bd biosynthesis fused ATPase/permease subunit